MSLTKVVPAVVPLVRDGGLLLMLVKPQFEAGRGEVGKGGIVRDATVRDAAIGRTVDRRGELTWCGASARVSTR